MNTLVTGGGGFIGKSIVSLILSRNERVKVYDDFSRDNSAINNFPSGVEVISGDIRDSNALKLAIKNVDRVIHLAYINGTQQFYLQPSKIMEVATIGMYSLLDATKNSQVKEFYLASSSEVYQSPNIFPTPEDVPLIVPDIKNPRYSYGLGKIVQEFLTIHSMDSIEKRTVFRPHNVYGPNMGFQHVIPELFKKIKESESGQILIKGSGEQRRSFCHISDFIKAFDLLLKTNDQEPTIYNIGTHFEATVSQLVVLIGDSLGISISTSTSEGPRGETERRLPDLSRLEGVGYIPMVDLKSGIEDYRDWFLANSSDGHL
jgi:dTDP-glucose 4,6-dehydratase/UDP-glucose 4-epimerase